MFKRGFWCYRRSREVVTSSLASSGDYTYRRMAVAITIPVGSEKRFFELSEDAIPIKSSSYVCPICGDVIVYGVNDVFHEWVVSSASLKRTFLDI